MKVLISDSLSQSGLDLLAEQEDLEVDVKANLTQEELILHIGNYDALIIRSATQVTTEVLAATDRLKIIGRAGVGIDNRKRYTCFQYSEWKYSCCSRTYHCVDVVAFTVCSSRRHIFEKW